MFKFKKEREKVEKSNLELVEEALDGAEKYLTKTIADMVSAAGGVTLDDVVDPMTMKALQNSMEYYHEYRELVLDSAARADQKEALLKERLDNQDKILAELLKEVKNKK